MRSCEPIVVRCRLMASVARLIAVVPHVVVHGLRDRDDIEPELVESGGVAERVVAADCNQVVEAEFFQVLEHVLAHVEHRRRDALFRELGLRKIDALNEVRDLLHLGGIRSAGVEERTARPVDGPRILARQGKNVAGHAGGIVEVDVRESFPASSDAGYFDAVIAGSVRDVLDDRIETWDIAATGQDAYALRRHEFS
jgi:hypothetical protein